MGIGAALVAAIIAGTCAEPGAPLRAFSAPSWADIPQHGLPTHLSQGVSWDAAGGEHEGAWVVLQPTGAWVSLEVTVSALHGRHATLGPERIRVLRASFERTSDSRIVADSAVPLERASVRDARMPESSNLPLWLDVEVEASTPPGEYRGSIRAKVGCESAELPVRLVVHPVRLSALEDEVLVTPTRTGGWTEAHARSAQRVGVRVLTGGQGGGSGNVWQIPVGDRDAIGLGLGAPGTSALAMAWLSERDGAEGLVYREGIEGLSRSVRSGQSLWYPSTDREQVVESVRLLRVRDALEMRALIAKARKAGQGAEVHRWSERLAPPGGHCSNDPDAYAAARLALLHGLGRTRSGR